MLQMDGPEAMLPRGMEGSDGKTSPLHSIKRYYRYVTRALAISARELVPSQLGGKQSYHLLEPVM
jgi:hypothetical protein